MEAWRFYRPLGADSHHFDEEQDPDMSEKLDPEPDLSEKLDRTSYKVLRIRNLGFIPGQGASDTFVPVLFTLVSYNPSS
jgi:hypothetical protein